MSALETMMPPVQKAKVNGIEMAYYEAGPKTGAPVDFVSGFRDADGKTRGRPVGVTVDPRGALIVADDLANTVWRVVPSR